MGGILDGQSVVITGGGSGLGRAIVARFIAEDAVVVVLDHSAEKVSTLRSEFGADLTVVEGDVRILDDNRRAIHTAVKAAGKLDAFVGNAAIMDFGYELTNLKSDQLLPAFREVMEVNLLGYIFGAHAATDELAKTRGSITYTLSSAGLMAGGGGPFYTMSKHAGVGLVRHLALELGPRGIRVNGVVPGVVKSTDLRGPRALAQEDVSLGKRRGEKRLQWASKTSLLGTVPENEHYTGIYALLANKTDALTATGAIINWDTGISATGLGTIVRDSIREEGDNC